MIFLLFFQFALSTISPIFFTPQGQKICEVSSVNRFKVLSTSSVALILRTYSCSLHLCAWFLVFLLPLDGSNLLIKSLILDGEPCPNYYFLKEWIDLEKLLVFLSITIDGSYCWSNTLLLPHFGKWLLASFVKIPKNYQDISLQALVVYIALIFC